MNLKNELLLLFPATWILIQHISILLLAILFLKILGLIKKPVSGLEYSQALVSAVIILIMTSFSIAGTQTYFDTFNSFTGTVSEKIQASIYFYLKYLLVLVFFEFLFIAIYWLIQRISLGLRPSPDSSIQEGNLPMAILFCGIVGGFGLGLGKMLSLILDRISPSIILYN